MTFSEATEGYMVDNDTYDGLNTSGTTVDSDAFLADLREHRLTAYEAMPADIREHYALEAEIAQNYRGRFVYELLQNADDAMAGGGLDDAVRVLLTPDALLVANTGRPISEQDVASLCGVSVSTKRVDGRKRASIGHKGMGFKSVLELTDQPAIYSTGRSFRFDRAASAKLLTERFGTDIISDVFHAPAMRLPFSVDSVPEQVSLLLDEGMETVFHFPLDSLSAAHMVANILGRMDAGAILFLRRLECVNIHLALGDPRHTCWKVIRKMQAADARWVPVGELPGTGMVRVRIEDQHDVRTFALFSRSDLEITDHRLGIEGSSWRDVELTEAAVAMPIDEKTGYLRPYVHDPRFHVFLATGERSPFPFLVNGAFNTDLSRQSIRYGEEALNYNRFLVEQVAYIVRDQIIPYAREREQPAAEILALLDRNCVRDEEGVTVRPESSAARILVAAVRSAFKGFPFLPVGGGSVSSIEEVAVFPRFSRDGGLGAAIRHALADTVVTGAGSLPRADLCGATACEVLADLGAARLAYADLPALFENPPRGRLVAEEREEPGLWRDLLLDLVTRIWWEILEADHKAAFRDAVRTKPLFPVGHKDEHGVLQHIATSGLGCFFPPYSLRGHVPFERLCFLSRDVYWGDTASKQRNPVPQDEKAAWQAIWNINEFKFPEVMRSAVTTRLTLERTDEETAPLKSFGVLAMICQLAGRAPAEGPPLPFERLGTKSALFRLASLPVPCRTLEGEETWVPAYRAYFGKDWVGDASVEALFETIDPESVDALPSLNYLVEPGRFVGLLGPLRHVSADPVGDLTEGAEEAAEDEDDEAALADNELHLWRTFFTWLGVNTSLRPIPFQDVDEARGGWLRTRGLSRPQGHWCQRLPDEKWSSYVSALEQSLGSVTGAESSQKYFVRLHDLEHLHTLQRWIAEGKTPEAAEGLFRHLARNWDSLSRITRPVLALVPSDRVPGRRGPPPRPWSDELCEVGHDFWLWRLRTYPWCPTVHGPRLPRESWVPGPEVKRRFQPARLAAMDQFLVPTLPADTARETPGNMADSLGLRRELSQSTFLPEDAATVCALLDMLFAACSGELDRSDLRDVIRPTYRHMFELMPATRKESGWGEARSQLADAPLLEHDGQGSHRFTQASKTLFAARRDTRMRLGDSQTLWTFILEGERAAQARLEQFFGARILEETVDWSPEPGEPSLSFTERMEFRAQLRAHAADLLCMLETDRSGPDQVQRDISRMREFIERVEPIESLRVSFKLSPDAERSKTRQRSHFVAKDRTTVFLVWDEVPWPVPLGERRATDLATALCEYLEVNQVLQFAALLNASSDDAREHILRAAGAPYGKDRKDKLVALRQESPLANKAGDAEGELYVAATLPEFDDEEQPLASSAQEELGDINSHVEPHPLYEPDQILIDGEPVLIHGDPPQDGKAHEGGVLQPASGQVGFRPGEPAISTRQGPQTDRNALDILGMHVALRFEFLRITRDKNQRQHERLSGGEIPAEGRVFDVSTPGDIDRARKASTPFSEAYDDLIATHGLNRHYPGFDILTLAPNGEVERCIELKSSGVSARVQEMTWNEWKVSSNNKLARRFYLYLVGNLRSDIPGAVPFVRTILDPMAQLRGAVVSEHRVQQKVQLRVDRFREAEEIVLTVLTATSD